MSANLNAQTMPFIKGRIFMKLIRTVVQNVWGILMSRNVGKSVLSTAFRLLFMNRKKCY